VFQRWNGPREPCLGDREVVALVVTGKLLASLERVRWPFSPQRRLLRKRSGIVFEGGAAWLTATHALEVARSSLRGRRDRGILSARIDHPWRNPTPRRLVRFLRTSTTRHRAIAVDDARQTLTRVALDVGAVAVARSRYWCEHLTCGSRAVGVSTPADQ
jgi:hypothetical protein